MISREWWTAAREPRWRALAGAFVTVVLAQGLSNSFPVFLLPISAELKNRVWRPSGSLSTPRAGFSRMIFRRQAKAINLPTTNTGRAITQSGRWLPPAV